MMGHDRYDRIEQDTSGHDRTRQDTTGHDKTRQEPQPSQNPTPIHGCLVLVWPSTTRQTTHALCSFPINQSINHPPYRRCTMREPPKKSKK
ncbi:hypothetical protein AOQ84DRAFT_188862 [Glonium stellatum]|uniref:Uncharacterized protein n=1 Tax=Glonium stellatum TaxID=574774 RepID=A0A8E2F6H1_9PEZI|nr:hypothetical protein AOQ84DRAFT_188862 [Glonium stellatum]